jgi:hypothetical protein
VFPQLTVATAATQVFVPNTWCEGELLAVAAAACIVLSKKKKQRRKHKVWVRQVFKREKTVVCYV